MNRWCAKKPDLLSARVAANKMGKRQEANVVLDYQSSNG